jgi:hypothetical protein
MDVTVQIAAMGATLGDAIVLHGPAVVGVGLAIFGGLAAIGLIFRALGIERW